jgi:hypothetical protein
MSRQSLADRHDHLSRWCKRIVRCSAPASGLDHPWGKVWSIVVEHARQGAEHVPGQWPGATALGEAVRRHLRSVARALAFKPAAAGRKHPAGAAVSLIFMAKSARSVSYRPPHLGNADECIRLKVQLGGTQRRPACASCARRTTVASQDQAYRVPSRELRARLRHS